MRLQRRNKFRLTDYRNVLFIRPTGLSTFCSVEWTHHLLIRREPVSFYWANHRQRPLWMSSPSGPQHLNCFLIQQTHACAADVNKCRTRPPLCWPSLAGFIIWRALVGTSDCSASSSSTRRRPRFNLVAHNQAQQKWKVICGFVGTCGGTWCFCSLPFVVQSTTPITFNVGNFLVVWAIRL
jgi:hypothetical protein